MHTHPSRQELEELTEQELDTLRRELGPGVDAERLTALGHEQFARLVEHATVLDFIPLLVYRFTKAALREEQANPMREAA
jgi:hypothetical protein